ncbi:MAG: hypothetical protein UCO57_01175 [Gemmiger sp.]|uniref:hypothetical protein n=1 Tax=Gemmiger sp. TaxID=2049027 RepID=UPI002E75D3A6|nr:hypothetical protein [Gemmiger sp.]MEE0707377.1 hypothetical protein [Gemmiger sp.]
MAETTAYYDSPLTGEELDEAFRKLTDLDNSVAAAAENEEKAAYWAGRAQTIANGALGWYENADLLRREHPTGENGQWAIVGNTDTIWLWDSDTKDWINTAARIDLSNYYTKEQANTTFATAAQGNLANTAVQSVNGKTGKALTLGSSDVGAAPTADVFPSVLAGGIGGVANVENQKTDFLLINGSDARNSENKPYVFGSEDPSNFINSPFTSGPFYGFRLVIISGHLITVLIIEQYPISGRIWANTYDGNSQVWYGWKQIGAVSAMAVYDEMTAAYNKGVSGV